MPFKAVSFPLLEMASSSTATCRGSCTAGLGGGLDGVTTEILVILRARDVLGFTGYPLSSRSDVGEGGQLQFLGGFS